MAIRTAATSLATALVLGAGTVAALTLGPAAQAEPGTEVTPPGPVVKTVTVCVTGPNGTPFAQNRIIARSGEAGVYKLRSATQTASVPGGCGTVAIGSTGTVKLRAVHVQKRKVRKNVCVRSVFRTQWPATDAASVADGSVVNGQLRLVSKRAGRC